MKWNILHESRGRIRLHLNKPRLSMAEADQLQAYLADLPGVRVAVVYERTCDAVITYTGARTDVLRGAAAFRFDVQALTEVSANSPRAVNHEYQEKLVNLTLFHFARKLFLPAPIRFAYTAVCSVRYLWHGLRCLLHRRLEVEVLDALSIGVSMLRGDFSTAGSVMFLLRLGELLEEWTRKKSLGDLAHCMSLNVDRVWQLTAEGEVLVPISQIRTGDAIIVHTGSVIPLDAGVQSTSAMTGVINNQGAYFFLDTHVQDDPTAEQIAEATLQATYRLKLFGIEPKVALLSHSNFGSHDTPGAQKMRKVRELLKQRMPKLEVDGEMQGDTAWDEVLRKRMMPNTTLNGRANLFVLPNIDAANITYNMVRVMTDGVALGPILMGVSQPAHVLTPTSTPRRVVNMTAIAAVDAQIRQQREAEATNRRAAASED